MSLRRSISSIVLGLLLATPVHAEERAGHLYQRALSRFAAADFDGARRLLERARPAAKDDAKLLGRIELQLGVCHDVLGKEAGARAAFRAALEHDAELALEPSRHRASALRLFNEVRDALRGELQVSCESGRGAVVLDGKALGQAPFSGQAPIGAHRLEVRALEGKTLWSGQIVIAVRAPVRVATPCPLPAAALTVRTAPPGATLLVDGRPVGRTPVVRAPLEGGPHRLTLERAGWRARVVEIDVAPGAEKDLELRMDPVRAPPASGPTTLPAKPPPPRPRRWTWIVGGSAVLTLGAGLGVGLSARADHEAWSEEWVDRERWDGLRHSGERKELAANVLFGVGAALAVTAAVLYFVEGRARRTEARAHAAPGVRSSCVAPDCLGAGNR
jgi:hypothetical protein